MDLAEYAIETFHRHLDSTMQAIESLSQTLGDASEQLVHTLLGEGKILCCGEGASGLLAQHFAEALLGRFQRERPSLPAISLGSDAALLTAIASEGSFSDIFARQIRALGQPRDTVLLVAHGSGSGTALQAILAAHDRGLRVVVLCNEQNNDLSALLAPDDIALRIPGTSRPRFLETGLVALHTLCELIELQLFGEEI